MSESKKIRVKVPVAVTVIVKTLVDSLYDFEGTEEELIALFGDGGIKNKDLLKQERFSNFKFKKETKDHVIDQIERTRNFEYRGTIHRIDEILAMSSKGDSVFLRHVLDGVDHDDIRITNNDLISLKEFEQTLDRIYGDGHYELLSSRSAIPRIYLRGVSVTGTVLIKDRPELDRPNLEDTVEDLRFWVRGISGNVDVTEHLSKDFISTQRSGLIFDCIRGMKKNKV